MNDLAIKVENVSKEYRLGVIGGTTLKEEIQSKMAKLRKKEDPNIKNPEAFASGFLICVLYTCQHEADISSGYGKEQRVHTVESAAMAGDKVAEIFYADHALEQGFSQITDLPHGGGQQGGEHTQAQRNGIV